MRRKLSLGPALLATALLLPSLALAHDSGWRGYGDRDYSMRDRDWDRGAHGWGYRHYRRGGDHYGWGGRPGGPDRYYDDRRGDRY